MRKLSRSNQGIALFSALLLVVLLAGFSCIYLMKVQKTAKIQSNFSSARQAQMNADKGLDRVRFALENDMDDGMLLVSKYKTDEYEANISLVDTLLYKVDVWGIYKNARGHSTSWVQFTRTAVTTPGSSPTGGDVFEVVVSKCHEAKQKILCGGPGQKPCASITTYVYSSREVGYTTD